ncbi:hypothetical protein [Devosia chinhatensis]|nr:hypothetical protein [Devosia chinhatensis]
MSIRPTPCYIAAIIIVIVFSYFIPLVTSSVTVAIVVRAGLTWPFTA